MRKCKYNFYKRLFKKFSRLRFILIYCLLFICFFNVDLHGQSNSKQLQDISLVLLKQIKSFTNYKLKYVSKTQPLQPQPSHLDTIEISYNSESNTKPVEFSAYVLNKTAGFAKGDSCRIYSVSGKVWSCKTNHCKPCLSTLEEFLYLPLNSDYWIKMLTFDTSLKISIESDNNILLLRLSKHSDSNDKFDISAEYSFNSADGFPIKYIERMEFNNNVQNIEYLVIEYSLLRDNNLDKVLTKIFSGKHLEISSDWFPYNQIDQ